MDKLLIIVVLYGMEGRESTSLLSLKEIVDKLGVGLDLLIYDNSPCPQVNPEFDDGINLFYFHDTRNHGLSAAYNYGLSIANANGCKWVLLLDQDSLVTEDYFLEVLDQVQQGDNGIDCFIPVVKSMASGVVLSPSRLFFGSIHGEKYVTYGTPEVAVSAINSGLVISVFFMNSIGGFNRDYFLDGLDHWLFRQVYRKHGKVFIMKSAILHDISIENYLNQVSLMRHRLILESMNISSRESAFMYFVQRLRLVKMLLRSIGFKNYRYFIETLKHIIR